MKFPILEMNRIRALLKKACVSVTILVIPHDHVRTLNVRVPGALLVLSLLLAVIGGGYVVSLAVSGLQYRAQHNAMAARVRFYSDQFYQWSSTVTSLRTVEQEFRNLFSLGSKEAVLEQADTSFKGSLEIPELVEELQHTLESVDEIKNYLRIQKDIFVATPRGYPVQGRITSSYGKRKDPLTGDDAFHSGIDISSGPGPPSGPPPTVGSATRGGPGRAATWWSSSMAAVSPPFSRITRRTRSRSGSRCPRGTSLATSAPPDGPPAPISITRSGRTAGTSIRSRTSR
jgi:hypothetical protein